MQNHRKKYAGTYAILTACMLVVLFALYIAVITSFMTKEEANYVEFHWIPKQGISCGPTSTRSPRTMAAPMCLSA